MLLESTCDGLMLAGVAYACPTLSRHWTSECGKLLTDHKRIIMIMVLTSNRMLNIHRTTFAHAAPVKAIAESLIQLPYKSKNTKIIKKVILQDYLQYYRDIYHAMCRPTI